MERQLADLALVDTGKPETEPNAASFSDCAVALGGAIALAGDAVPSELQRLCTQVPSGQSDAFGDMVLRSMQANGFGATTRMLAAALAEVADPAVFALHSLRHICRRPNKGAVAACTVSPARIQLGTACAIHIAPTCLRPTFTACSHRHITPKHQHAGTLMPCSLHLPNGKVVSSSSPAIAAPRPLPRPSRAP